MGSGRDDGPLHVHITPGGRLFHRTRRRSVQPWRTRRFFVRGARQAVRGISSVPASGPRWPEECSHEHPLCPRFTARAARAPRPSGKSSTTPGTISSPATKSTTAAPWDRCAPMPSPPSAPSFGAAISPRASLASIAPSAATKSSSPSPASPATSAPPATSAASARPADGSPPPSATKSRTGSMCSPFQKCCAASSASAPRNRRETGGCRPEVSHFGRPSLLPPACGLKPQA